MDLGAIARGDAYGDKQFGKQASILYKVDHLLSLLPSNSTPRHICTPRHIETSAYHFDHTGC